MFFALNSLKILQKRSWFSCRRPCPRGGFPGFPEKAPRGNTPLHVAAYWGNVEAAELLLSKGAAVDATNLAGPGPQIREACVRNPVSNLGHVKKFFGLEILRKKISKCLVNMRNMLGSMITI